MFKLRVPATSANLGPGFDCLGIALKLYNTFCFRKIKSGVKIKIKDCENGREILLNPEDNLLFKSFREVYKKFDQSINGIEIIEEVSIPFSRGLGSSASAIIGGIVGANILLGNPLTTQEILELATKIEGHPDNVVPALTGGFTINIMKQEKLIYKKITVDKNLKSIIVIPDFQLNTESLRKVLPKNVSFEDAVFNQSRTALLTACLIDNDWENLFIAMEDKLHQDYRSDLIPGFDEIIYSAYEADALGVALSGAGPTIIAFAKDNLNQIGKTIKKVFAKHNIKSKYLITGPENSGLKIF